MILAVIEAEAHFIQVGRELLRRTFMPRSHNAPLEQREGRFHGAKARRATLLPTDFVTLVRSEMKQARRGGRATQEHE